MPTAMPLIRSSGFFMQLNTSTTSSTNAASPMFCIEPKVPLPNAANPPPNSVIATPIRLRPIIITTTPLTVGVITFFRYGSSQAEPATRNAPTKATPKSADIMALVSMPCSFMPLPSAIITPTKEKFTDWMDSSPEPTGPKRFTCK